jgi:hypothetical protein
MCRRYFRTDIAFYKNFRVGDRMRIQFRWDIFLPVLKVTENRQLGRR